MDKFDYSIDIDKILGDDDFSMVTKLTLVMIQNTEYLTLGTYFQKLCNTDLEAVLELAEEAHVGQNDDNIFCQAVCDLIVMSQALAQAEGAPPQCEAEAHTHVNYFIMMANCVSLERKGLVTIDYDRITFDADIPSGDVVKLKPGVNPDDFEPDDA